MEAKPVIITGKVFLIGEKRMIRLRRNRKIAFANHPLYITFMYSLKAFTHPVIAAVPIQTRCLSSRAARKEPEITAVRIKEPEK